MAIGLIISNSRKQSLQNYYDLNVLQEFINKYSVKVHIDFTENLIFSKYDVIVSIDNDEQAIPHGESTDLDFLVTGGSHTLCFTSAENSSIKAEVPLEVNSNLEVGYKISCYSDKISVTNLYVDDDTPVDNDKVEIKSDKNDFVNKNYKDVIASLEELGFINIVEEPMYDIVFGFTSEGEVENVTIDGSDTYKRGDIFPKDVKIVVSYHLKEDNDPSKIKPPYDTDKAQGVNYKDVIKAFKEAGFTNITTEKRFSSAFGQHETNTVANIYINGNSFDMDRSSFKPDAEVRIDYYAESESGKSNTKLSAYYAQKAFEKHGEKLYPYGFKCHWFADYIAEEQRSDGSWFLKVGVTITNAYGTDYKTVAEAVISGTDTNPKVSQFHVSN